MSWQTPKTDWSAPDGVRFTDMNRIEGNILSLYEESARSNRIIYVATTGNDSTGDGSSANPYKTITKALSVVPKNLAGLNASIHIAAGTYSEAVSIKGFTGGVLRLSGNSANVTINSLTIEACVVSAVSLPLTLTAAIGLILSECASFRTTSDITTSGGSTGVNVNTNSSVSIAGEHTNSASTAVACSGNSFYCATAVRGSGTLHATYGGVIAANASSLTRSTSSGGRVHIGSQSSGGGGGVLPSTVE